jgi:hypothetical protein
MEAISVQWEKTLLELENTYLQRREQLMKVNIDKEIPMNFGYRFKI